MTFAQSGIRFRRFTVFLSLVSAGVCLLGQNALGANSKGDNQAKLAPEERSDTVHLGGLVGAGSYFSSNFGTNPQLTLDAGYKITHEIDVAVDLSFHALSGYSGGVTGAMTYILPRGSYYLSSVKGLSLGASAGLGIWTQSTPSISLNGERLVPAKTYSSLFFTLGPSVGYDYEISKHFTLSAQGSVLFGLISTGSANSAQLLAGAKWWL